MSHPENYRLDEFAGRSSGRANHLDLRDSHTIGELCHAHDSRLPVGGKAEGTIKVHGLCVVGGDGKRDGLSIAEPVQRCLKQLFSYAPSLIGWQYIDGAYMSVERLFDGNAEPDDALPIFRYPDMQVRISVYALPVRDSALQCLF